MINTKFLILIILIILLVLVSIYITYLRLNRNNKKSYKIYNRYNNKIKVGGVEIITDSSINPDNIFLTFSSTTDFIRNDTQLKFVYLEPSAQLIENDNVLIPYNGNLYNSIVKCYKSVTTKGAKEIPSDNIVTLSYDNNKYIHSFFNKSNPNLLTENAEALRNSASVMNKGNFKVTTDELNFLRINLVSNHKREYLDKREKYGANSLLMLYGGSSKGNHYIIPVKKKNGGNLDVLPITYWTKKPSISATATPAATSLNSLMALALAKQNQPTGPDSENEFSDTEGGAHGGADDIYDNNIFLTKYEEVSAPNQILKKTQIDMPLYLIYRDIFNFILNKSFVKDIFSEDTDPAVFNIDNFFNAYCEYDSAPYIRNNDQANCFDYKRYGVLIINPTIEKIKLPPSEWVSEPAASKTSRTIGKLSQNVTSNSTNNKPAIDLGIPNVEFKDDDGNTISRVKAMQIERQKAEAATAKKKADEAALLAPEKPTVGSLDKSKLTLNIGAPSASASIDLNKYYMMVKKGIPLDAVCLKMGIDRIPQTEITQFKTNDGKAPTQPASESIDLKKYYMMVKTGTPLEAVYFKMGIDGIAQTEIDQFRTNNGIDPAQSTSASASASASVSVEPAQSASAIIGTTQSISASPIDPSVDKDKLIQSLNDQIFNLKGEVDTLKHDISILLPSKSLQGKSTASSPINLQQLLDESEAKNVSLEDANIDLTEYNQKNTLLLDRLKTELNVSSTIVDYDAIEQDIFYQIANIKSEHARQINTFAIERDTRDSEYNDKLNEVRRELNLSNNITNDINDIIQQIKNLALTHKTQFDQLTVEQNTLLQKLHEISFKLNIIIQHNDIQPIIQKIKDMTNSINVFDTELSKVNNAFIPPLASLGNYSTNSIVNKINDIQTENTRINVENRQLNIDVNAYKVGMDTINSALFSNLAARTIKEITTKITSNINDIAKITIERDLAMSQLTIFSSASASGATSGIAALTLQITQRDREKANIINELNLIIGILNNSSLSHDNMIYDLNNLPPSSMTQISDLKTVLISQIDKIKYNENILIGVAHHLLGGSLSGITVPTTIREITDEINIKKDAAVAAEIAAKDAEFTVITDYLKGIPPTPLNINKNPADINNAINTAITTAIATEAAAKDAELNGIVDHLRLQAPISLGRPRVISLTTADINTAINDAINEVSTNIKNNELILIVDHLRLQAPISLHMLRIINLAAADINIAINDAIHEVSNAAVLLVNTELDNISVYLQRLPPGPVVVNRTSADINLAIDNAIAASEALKDVDIARLTGELDSIARIVSLPAGSNLASITTAIMAAIENSMAAIENSNNKGDIIIEKEYINNTFSDRLSKLIATPSNDGNFNLIFSDEKNVKKAIKLSDSNTLVFIPYNKKKYKNKTGVFNKNNMPSGKYFDKYENEVDIF